MRGEQREQILRPLDRNTRHVYGRPSLAFLAGPACSQLSTAAFHNHHCVSVFSALNAARCKTSVAEIQ